MTNLVLEQELLAIKGEDELLTAEAVVVWAARHRRSAVASRLEWDDAKAGHQHRLNQARQLIVSLEISMAPNTRMFYSLSIDRGNKRGGGYRDIRDIIQSKTLYDILMADALNELRRMQEQYERLTELAPLWKEVEKIRKRKKGKDKDGDRPST
jgi:hypothetical protein